MSRGLYLHIPFCRAKCHYCNFVIALDKSGTLRRRFLDSLALEIREARARYGKLRFDTLYFGGGTPSMLAPGELREILDQLNSAFEFASGPDFEFTLEMNPEDVEPGKLDAFRALGANRASLGAQSFNDKLLREMGRLHTSADTARAAGRLQQAGFRNISLDLILKLPAQTIDDVRHALDEVVCLAPGQVSVYDLDVHHNSVFGLSAKKGTLTLPSEDKHHEMTEMVENQLTGAGYIQYELTNFARLGFESRHNLIYWHNQEYLGLGPGAFSYMSGVRYQFAPTVNRYLGKCESGDWTRDEEDVISGEKSEIETLLTGIRLKEGIDPADFTLIRSELEPKLEELFQLNFLGKVENRFVLTRQGRYLAESVLRELAL